MGLQVTQDLGAVMGFAHGIAQLAAKTVLGRRVEQERLHFRWQAVDHFLQQVVADQPFPTVQALRQGALVAGFGSRQQPKAQAGHPALAAANQAVEGFTTQGTAVAIQQRLGFGMGQAQVLLVQLQQMP